MDGRELHELVGRLCVLDDAVRLRAYDEVRRHGQPATRSHVADVLGISVNLAAYHLDKLVDVGLLQASYARPPGSGGRGGGRPAKHYEPAEVELEVSIPPRRYDLAASLLAGAVEDLAAGEAIERAGHDAAYAVGRQLGGSVGDSAQALERLGYAPAEEQRRIVLRNCPFRRIAESNTTVVCALNLALIRGLLAGARDRRSTSLTPSSNSCCVIIGTGR